MMKWLDAQRTHSPVGPFSSDPVTRTLFASAFLMVAMAVVLIIPWFLDARLVEGVNVWTKPQKFNLSLFVHFLTLAALAQTLPEKVRAGPILSLFTYLSLVGLLFETIYVVLQAARGRRSHFNFETQTEALLYAAMGVGALLLVMVAIVLGLQIWRRGTANIGLRLGAVLGLVLGGLLTIILAGYMSSINGARWVGDHPLDGATVPFFGWSREVGDLRPAHFVAMHLMQTMPLLGWGLDRLFVSRRMIIIIVCGAAVLQILLALFIFYQALAGNPVWPVSV